MEKEITIVRTFDVPRERVWKAWTDPKELAQWWGPKGVTNPTCEFDARPGGAIRIVMLAGAALGPLAGQEWPMTGKVLEFVPSEKLVFTGGPIDTNCKMILEPLTTVTLHEENGKTKMTVHILVTKTTPEADGPLSGMKMGWDQQIDKLGEFLVR